MQSTDVSQILLQFMHKNIKEKLFGPLDPLVVIWQTWIIFLWKQFEQLNELPLDQKTSIPAKNVSVGQVRQVKIEGWLCTG